MTTDGGGADCPAWLRPLLDHEIVQGDSPFDRVNRAAQVAMQQTSDPAVGSSARVHFATVDELDTNLVVDFFAVDLPEGTSAGPSWWHHDGRSWRRIEGEPQAATGSVLRWVRPETVPSVESQLSVSRAKTSAAVGGDTEQLRLRLLRALRHGGVGSLDTDWGYVQWAGYPDGLLVEVGDGRPAEHPLEGSLWEKIRWHGWNAPDGEHRNAWFEAREPGAVDAALDVLERTLATLSPEPRWASPIPGALWPSEPNDPDDIHPDRPHVFDPSDEPGCFVCDRPQSADVHVPPIVVVSAKPASDSLHDLVEDARRWSARCAGYQVVLLDLIDAFPDTEATPVPAVDVQMVTSGAASVVAELAGRAESSVVRIALSTRYTERFIEGAARPFSVDPERGRRLAGLCQALSAAGVQVLVTTLEVAVDDPFIGALAGMPGVAWVRGAPHEAVDDGSGNCLECGSSAVAAVHLTDELPPPVIAGSSGEAPPTSDPGPCARCLGTRSDTTGQLVWVPESGRSSDGRPYTHECLECGERNWRTPHESHVVVDLDRLLEYFDVRDIQELADVIEANYDVELEAHETSTIGPAFECGGSGMTIPYSADVAEFINLMEANEQSLFWTEDDDDDDW